MEDEYRGFELGLAGVLVFTGYLLILVAAGVLILGCVICLALRHTSTGKAIAAVHGRLANRNIGMPELPVDESQDGGDESGADEDEEEEEEDDDGKNAGDVCCSLSINIPKSWAVGIVLGCPCFIVVLVGALFFVGWKQVSRAANDDTWHDARVPPPDFPRYMGCGGCQTGNKTDKEIEACVSDCFTLKFVKTWESFAQSHPWKLVYFPSRPEPGAAGPGEQKSVVNISAWWLPADPSRVPRAGQAPRIVVLHGLSSNNNHCGVQATCFHLRSIGFSCLTPTVRDYGLSGQSTHPTILSWGYDYHLDLLGAWDYAVKDPDGLLGGPMPPDKVGIMGFSKGALATAMAFGLDQQIPAAWIDSAPYTSLFGMIDFYVRPFAGAFTPLIRGPVYLAAQIFSRSGGVDLDKYNALRLLSNCTGPPRGLAVVQDSKDAVVPPSESSLALRFLSGLRKCYNVHVYMPPAECYGDTHHTYMWAYPDDARAHFCRFWSRAFQQNEAQCGLEKLPRLQKQDPVDGLPEIPRVSH